MKYFYIIGISISFFIGSANSYSDTRLVWNGQPISLNIAVGKEVRVRFPADVFYQVPLAVSSKLIALAPNPTMIYLKPTDSFDTARILFQSYDGKSLYIVDLSASDSGITDSVYIEDPSRLSPPNVDTKEISSTLDDPSEIVLSRFASQVLYGPRRLTPINEDITEINIPVLDHDFPLLRSDMGENYSLFPIKAWSGYGKFITAIVVVNNSEFEVPVKFENVRGSFTNISSQHSYFGPKGSRDNLTTYYLISDTPFDSAILEDSYGY